MAFRTIGLSLFFIVVFTAIGALVGLLLQSLRLGWGPVFTGLIFLIISLLLSAIAFLYSPSIILRKYKAKPSQNKELNEIVDQMAMNAKIPTPKVYISPINAPNSFAVGRSKDNAAVCVTEGLLSMNKGEIESVVAHEVWHIANSDIFIQEFAAVIAAVLRLTVILIPLAVFVVRLSLSERVEFRADYYASRFSRKPHDMASALSKMSEIARQNPMKGSPAFEGMWVINPFKREGVRRWFYTHPPTARRTKRLEDMSHEGMPETPEATEVD